jgi:two-component system nitrate/nitrite response regulator NarP
MSIWPKSATESPISIMLADNNPLMLAAMSEVFERDKRFSLVATSATAEGFLGTVIRMPVRVGVIDWNLPALGGAKLIDVLREQPNPPKLVVYGDENSDTPRKAMASGAAGFSARSASVDRLVETCIAVAKGQMIFPFLDIRSLQQDPINQLSKREKALLEALSTGLTNRELARQFEISPNTVKFHLSNLFEKLSVKNRTQAIAFYYANRSSRGDF